MPPSNWIYHNPQFEYDSLIQDHEQSWDGHQYFAYDLVSFFKPKIIVELGSYLGTSFFAMSQAVKDKKINSKLHAIDTWQGDKQTGFYDQQVFNMVKLISKNYYNKLNIKLIKKNFDQAEKEFSKQSIDLLHIDGLHTYKAVKHDFDTWLPKVKNNGIILFHDTAETKDDFGVYRLWEKLKKQYATLEFFHSHGLGVLFMPKNKYKSLTENKIVWQKYYNNLASYQALLKQTELFKTHQKLKQAINVTQDKIDKYNLRLHKIRTNDLFKLWQLSCRIKSALLTKK